ncbi:26S proteasome non-ATPase regulatory subunit 10-like [Sitophilus oryzae]|uniref:26S proteasome non-ATPase regulatory subunit 10-like n=1 Tax=Sitophilus oryzae TaxID=7048 RepID=A0A6J2YR69_SITOR|nr:26S proteasome non-ATPase regulatory subunit 10-like [Sitophilus oryzae]
MSKFKDSFSKLKENKEDLDKQFLTAVQRDDLHFVNYCIEIGIDVNCVNENHQTALHLIAEKGNKCIGTILLKAPNINIDAKDSMGDTPLMYAVSNDQLKFVKLLLKSKANPNMQNHFEKTPLHIAVSQGDANLVTALLDYNANPNMQDAYGNTPLSLSTMEYHNENIAKILLMSGANPDLETQKPQCLLTGYHFI